MRINRYISLSTGISRRGADKLIAEGRVKINGIRATLGDQADDKTNVTLDDKQLDIPRAFQTIMLNKPVGYVVSRDGQGSKTIYDLLPTEYTSLKPVGRLDKDSSGLLLLTNNGQLAEQLTHPKYQKTKIYIVSLNKDLSQADQHQINNSGVELDDGLSLLKVTGQDGSSKKLIVSMNEGRNRQIRRTFERLGYKVVSLKRINFGSYTLGSLKEGTFKLV